MYEKLPANLRTYRDIEEMRGRGVKACRSCGVEYKNTEENFHANPQSADKLHYDCKKCRSAHKKMTKASRKRE